MALNHDPHAGDERDAGLDRTYAATRLEEPPASLDAAIRAAARREAGSRPRAASSRLRAWHVPVSIAAVIVLSFSLIMILREEGADRLTDSAASDPVRPERAAAPPAPAPDAELWKPASPPLADRGDTPRPSPETRDRAASRAPALRREAPAEKRLGELSSPAASSPPAAGMARQQAEPAAPPAGPARQAPLEVERRKAMAEDRPRALAKEEARSAEAARDAAAPSAARAALEGAVAGELKALESEPPARWVERIGELRRQGKPELADAVLVELRRRHPAYPLPGEQRQ